jgi:hypothetical protein
MGNHFSVSEREEKSLQLGEGDLTGGSTHRLFYHFQGNEREEAWANVKVYLIIM